VINRDQWSEIYDMARHNGLSPLDFIAQAMHRSGLLLLLNIKDEEAIYNSCRQFSISRTRYPSMSIEDPS
jgi:hypothetical protein